MKLNILLLFSYFFLYGMLESRMQTLYRRFFMQTEKKRKGFTGSALKIIAMISMVIDHTAACLLYPILALSNEPIEPGSLVYGWYITCAIMRQLGRLAFPIFCFLLVEGFYHTSNRRNYALRLFAFALISEVPFDLAVFQNPWYPAYQNVFFTLLLGLLTIWALDVIKRRHPSLLLQLPIMACGCILAWLLRTDYDWRGIVLILIFYIFYQYPVQRTIAGCISLYWEPAAMLAFLPIWFYNGKRGLKLKYIFYVFYPAHLLLLGILCHIITA